MNNTYMNDRELLEFIAVQVGGLTNQIDGLTNRVDVLTNIVDGLTGQVGELKDQVDSLKNIVIRVENDHGKKLQALFDGHAQLRNQLERIEEKVSEHEEIILKKVF